MRKMIAMGLFAALLLAAQAALGQSDAKAEAKRHFDAGLALFEAEKYDAAALELEASVKLFPTKGGLFNLANVYKVMSRYDDALAAMDRLNKEFGGKLDAEMRDAVAKMKAEVEGFVARLDVQVSPAGAVVFVDGREVGKGPLAKPLSVDPGKHVVRAELAGYEPQEEKVQILSGQVERVVLTLVAEAGAAVPTVAAVPAVAEQPAEPEGATAVEPLVAESPSIEAPSAEDGARKKIGPAPLIVAGVVAVGAGVAALVINAKVGDKADQAKADGDPALMDDADKLQIVGQAMFGVAVAGAVAAAVLVFFTDFGGGKKAQAAAKTETARGLELDGVWPLAFENGAGAALGGRF